MGIEHLSHRCTEIHSMPELPEVETMRRGILSIVGQRIVAIHDAQCRCRPISISPSLQELSRLWRGSLVSDVTRLGKRVVIHNDRGLALVFEPRMTGLVSLTDPPDEDHVRLRFEFEQGEGPKELLIWDRRGLGTLSSYSGEELIQRVASRLGPDALAVSCDDLQSCFATSRAPIKVALLDQKRLAGVGNLYASEILFAAKIHPTRLSDQLSLRDWKRVHEELVRILNEAIESEGSTLSDGTYRNALNEAGGYQNHHQVYDREGERCYRCKTGIVERMVQAQRATFFCPRCQKTPAQR